MTVGRWLQVSGGVLVILLLLLGCVLFFPRLIYPPLPEADLDAQGVTGKDRIQLQGDRLKLQNDARGTLIQGLGGLLVLTGAGIGAAVSLRQLRINREGQITERFTRAVEQLGSDKVDIRLGGIYALARIAKDSATDRASIKEVLSAFVRGHAPWPPSNEAAHDAEANLEDLPDLQRRAPDVQAVLTVLGRLPEVEGTRLNLSGSDLRKANLAQTNLPGADFQGCHLEGSDFEGANLNGANFYKACLREAWFEFAELKKAHLLEAEATEAFLINVDADECAFTQADLTGADLGGTSSFQKSNFVAAVLRKANLQKVNLEGANFNNAILDEANLRGCNAHGVSFMDASLKGTCLEQAFLGFANFTTLRELFPDEGLQGTDLRGASLEGALILSTDFRGVLSDDTTKWPKGFDSTKVNKE